MRWRIKQLLIGFLSITFLFMLLLLRLMFSLDEETSDSHDVKSQARTYPQKFNDIENEYKVEIAELREQVHQLSMTVASLRNDTKPSQITDSFNSDVRLKTEVFGGYSYINEKAVEPFTHFNMWNLYPPHPHSSSSSVERVQGLKRRQLDKAMDAAVMMLNNSTLYGSQKWRRDQFIDGIYRRSTSVGTHYDLTFCNDDKTVCSRVTVFAAEYSPVPIKELSLQNQKQVLNIVMPLSSDRLDSIQSFLHRFKEIIQTKQQNYDLSLTLVYFGESHKQIKTHLQSFTLKTKFRKVRLEQVTDRNFSRGYGLDVGIRSWKGKEDPVLFFCDVDIVFELDFLRRCLDYSKKERSVYFPIVFSLYNPSVIENFFDQRFPSWKEQLKISSNHGFWRHFGYGMACMYRSDYLRVGGFDTDITSWGEEDILLFRKFAQSNLTAYRATDPNIYHLWHKKSCDPELSNNKYYQCMKSKATNEGSQMELAYMLFKDEMEWRRKARERL